MALAPVAASAQVSVEVSPLRVEVKMATAGAAFTQTVTLNNRDKEAVRVRARVDDWSLARDGTPQFVLAEAPAPYSAASWVRLNPTEQVIAGGATGTVRFTTTAPAGTTAGSYRAAIMFEFSPAAGDVLSRGIAIRSRVATVLYVTLGTGKAAVDLVDVQPREIAGQPPAIIVTLKNTGRFHVRTKGQIVIFDKAGAQVRRLQVPDVPVLPESERDVAIETALKGQPPLAAGDYRVEVRIDVGLPTLLVGESTFTIGR